MRLIITNVKVEKEKRIYAHYAFSCIIKKTHMWILNYSSFLLVEKAKRPLRTLAYVIYELACQNINQSGS